MKRIAVDLAMSVYQVAESVRAGEVMQRRRLNREAFARYVQEQAEPVEWVMEACGTAHYWGRIAQSRGHRVLLLHPRYVRPYRRRNKTDRNDCDAILEAARCAGIHPVPVKSHEQQQVQQLHNLRETWKRNRVQRINLLRGIFREMGIEVPASGLQESALSARKSGHCEASCRWYWPRSPSMSNQCASAKRNWRAGMPRTRWCTSSMK